MTVNAEKKRDWTISSQEPQRCGEGSETRISNLVMNSIPVHMQEENSSSAGQLVRCSVCGNSMKSITNSHLKKHGMTCEDYRIKFPGSSMGDFSRFDAWRSSEENRLNMKKANELVYSTPEIREKRKERLKDRMKTSEYRKTLSDSMKRYAQTPEGKMRLSNKPTTARMRLSNFQRWVEDFGIEEAVKRQLDWQSKNIIPSSSKDTKPELLLADMLRISGLSFIKQFPLPRIYCDFYLPEHNLIIEVDGDYWHANPDRFSQDDKIGPKKVSAHLIWANDLKREEKIKSHGYKVMRIWASSLKTKTAQQLVEDIVQHCEKSQ